MDILRSIIFTVNIFSALGVVFLVLMQQGKGADVGASFGGGASGSIFGAGGSANFLSRSTAVLASIFLASCLALGYIEIHRPIAAASGALMESAVVAPPAASAQPVNAQTGAALPQQSAVQPENKTEKAAENADKSARLPLIAPSGPRSAQIPN